MTLYMPLFRSCSTLRTLPQLHAHLLVHGLLRDPLPTTKLIESYAQMGHLQSSNLLFNSFHSPDSFMWAVLIKTHVWNRSFDEAIVLYNNMLRTCDEEHVRVGRRFIYPSVLRACSFCGDVDYTGRKIHGTVIKSGLEDRVTETCLMSMYGEVGWLHDARKVFDNMSTRDVVSWSSLISCYFANGEVHEGLGLFLLMVEEGIEPDSVTMLSLAEACAELGSLDLARLLHAQVIVRGIEVNGSLNNTLVVMYSKCGDLSSAEILFSKTDIGCRTTASWTAMISSYNYGGCFQEAVDVFLRMQECKVEANAVTLMAILGSCARLGWLIGGKSIHGFIIRNDSDPEFGFLGPALIEFYADCGRVCDSEKIFHLIQEKDVILWNMLMSVYSRKGMFEECLLMLVRMLAAVMMPDSFSLVTSLSICGNMGLFQLGHQIHQHIIKTGFLNEYVHNALIGMYSKCGHVDSAYGVFDEVQHRSVVTWNSMISGFSQSGFSLEAIHLLDRMYVNNFPMNEVTFLSAIHACAQICFLEKGKWLHHKIITCGIEKDSYIDSALIDMYVKCGELQTAQAIFDNTSARTVSVWSAMIAGCGMNGQVDCAISLFTQMMELGIKPNDVTFTNILSACSHAGYTERGKFYFNLMKKMGIDPQMEHFACFVDLLSRAGNLDEAYILILSMPFLADSSIWATLLNGCRVHRRVDMIKKIQKVLSDVDTDDTGYYTLLSNIHAEERNWHETRKIRSIMDRTDLKKVPGYSMIELGKRAYRFSAGDTSNLEIEDALNFLRNFQKIAVDEGSLGSDFLSS